MISLWGYWATLGLRPRSGRPYGFAAVGWPPSVPPRPRCCVRCWLSVSAIEASRPMAPKKIVPGSRWPCAGSVPLRVTVRPFPHTHVSSPLPLPLRRSRGCGCGRPFAVGGLRPWCFGCGATLSLPRAAGSARPPPPRPLRPLGSVGRSHSSAAFGRLRPLPLLPRSRRPPSPRALRLLPPRPLRVRSGRRRLVIVSSGRFPPSACAPQGARRRKIMELLCLRLFGAQWGHLGVRAR